MDKLKAAWPYVRRALTHKATYTALLAVAGVVGYAKAPQLVDAIQAVVTAVIGPIQ